jgi:hypothetical protein
MHPPMPMPMGMGMVPHAGDLTTAMSFTEVLKVLPLRRLCPILVHWTAHIYVTRKQLAGSTYGSTGIGDLHSPRLHSNIRSRTLNIDVRRCLRACRGPDAGDAGVPYAHARCGVSLAARCSVYPPAPHRQHGHGAGGCRTVVQPGKLPAACVHARCEAGGTAL